MAQNTHVDVTAGAWTQLSNADVPGAVTFQNLTNSAIWIMPTTSATAPTSTDGALIYNPGQGQLNTALSALAPGGGAVVRLYAYSRVNGKVYISHA